MNKINQYSCLPEVCILLVCYRKEREAHNKGTACKTIRMLQTLEKLEPEGGIGRETCKVKQGGPGKLVTFKQRPAVGPISGGGKDSRFQGESLHMPEAVQPPSQSVLEPLHHPEKKTPTY